MNPDSTPEANELTRQANAWVARITSGQATVEDARALREWCERSPAHAFAYQETTRLWKQLGHVADAGYRAPRRRYLRAGLAACVLLVGCLWLPLTGAIGDSAWLSHPFSNDVTGYRTGTGERREVTLEDGSRVQLDARTHLRLDFSAERRRIVLSDGAAVFHVWHDASRPFVVETENGTVTALGTVFEVRHRVAAINVICSEGVVAVRQPGQSPRRLEAGQQLQYDSRGSSAPVPVDSTEALAWRSDLLVFKQRPLAELVEELNRYRPGHIVLASADAARRPVSGVFHLQRTDEALEHISTSLGLTATYLPGDWVVLR